MSYSLRSKAKPGEQNSSSTLDAGSSAARSALRPPPAIAMKSFRDAVAVRTLPRLPTGEKEPSSTPVAERETEIDDSVQAPVVGSEETSHTSLSGLSDDDEDDGNGPWTTVQPRRSRSLESLRKLRSNRNYIPHKVNQNEMGDDPNIDAAVESLTDNQRKHINRREKTVRSTQDNSRSHEEGPSRLKGKGPDPSNWGNVGINPDELDAEAQRKGFEFFESLKKIKHARGDKPKKANSPEKDPEEAAQESSEPHKKTEKVRISES
jgi:hypothetical protein